MRVLTVPALAIACALALAPARAASPRAPSPDPDRKIAPWLRTRLASAGRTPFLVLLEDTAHPRPLPAGSPRDVYERLRSAAAAAQEPALRDLARRGVAVRRFWLVDALLVEGDLALARELAARRDVHAVVGNPRVRGVSGGTAFITSAFSPAAAPLAPASVEWGVSMVRAPEVWATGNRGEGIVVGSMDTGVDWTHPAIQRQYRGYDASTGTVDHRWSWHDPVGESPAVPTDDYGHGTHTVGTMVGDDGAGNQVGVAPGARWIGCRNMDHGNGTPALYLDCMEWTLAPYPPGGDPLVDGRPDLAPQVVNNSWTCPVSEGCDWDTLQTAFERVRAAGVFEIAAAGNSGWSCGTIDEPPAIYDAVFTVAAVDSSRALASFSSRGPVNVDGSARAKPDVSAPGVSVRSAYLDHGYASTSGTSMAAPHVAGAAALLWSGRPALRGLVDVSRCVLARAASRTVTDSVAQACGATDIAAQPNDMSGWGLVDAAAALALPDGDGDAVPDACDCAPADAHAFAAPAEVADVRFAPPGHARLTWTAQAPASGDGTVYDVVRGDAFALAADRGPRNAACVASGLAQPALDDDVTPAAGHASYYLVRARNACAVAGWGAASDGAPRTNASCP